MAHNLIIVAVFPERPEKWVRNEERLWPSSPSSSFPHWLEDAPVQIGSWNQNSTVKERKHSQSRWAPTHSPEECADYSGTGLWQSLNTIMKQREMIKSVTRVSANLFKKVARPKRRMWGMGGSIHSWSWLTRHPGQQSQLNVGGTPFPTFPSKVPKGAVLTRGWGWGLWARIDGLATCMG